MSVPYTPDELRVLLRTALIQKDAYPKALANFLFREIIEDAHVKYNISQEDMRRMCKKAVNRAALYIALKESGRPTTDQAFAIHALGSTEWDESEVTEEIEAEMNLIAACEKILMEDEVQDE